MPKLNDVQSLLLSTASQREGGSIFPLPDGTAAGARTTKAIAALTKAGLVEERETGVPDATSRVDGDLQYGRFITAAGLQAIGIEPDGAADAPEQPDVPAPAASGRTTKAAAVVALLSREQGATLAELIAATGWLPHTTRAALTGLRKKGHAVTRGKRGNETCYSVAAA